MTNGKHTAGPWSYDGHGINSIAESNKGERIFKTCLDYSHGSVDRERAIADSNLVAAAPELYEALKALAPILDNDSPLADAYADVAVQVEAAIAKAEGR